jgi:hypothetical protein
MVCSVKCCVVEGYVGVKTECEDGFSASIRILKARDDSPSYTLPFKQHVIFQFFGVSHSGP